MSLRRLSRGLAYRTGRAFERFRDVVAPTPPVSREDAGRSVLVHVGAHKTGSTTIQFLLRQMTRDLARRGVAYERGAYELGAELSRRSPLPAAERDALAHDLDERIDSCGAPVAVLSSESFFGDAFAGYANGAAVASDLASMLRGRRVTVVALVRRQDTFLSSLYGQHIKEGGTLSFAAFRGAYPAAALEWDERLSALDAAFGSANVRTLAYETVFADPERVLHRVFGSRDLALDFPSPPAPRRNPSLNAEGLRIMAEQNERLGEQARRDLRRRLQEEHSRNPGEPDALLSGGVGASIVGAYRASNERLFDSRLSDDPARAYYLGS